MSLLFPQSLAALFEAAPFGVIAINRAGVVAYVNPRQCENSQLQREDFLGKHHRTAFYTTLASQGLLPFYDRLQQEGVPFEVTFPHYQRHSDGTARAFSMWGYKHEGYTLLFTLIEKALEVQQARYQQLFENANDGIFILDRQARFVTVNHKFAELTGLPEEAIIGKTTELFVSGRFAQSLERLEYILREGTLGPYEVEMLTPLGPKIFSLNGFALYEGDTPVGVMSIARDVTEEQRRKQEREALYELAHDLARSSEVHTIADHLFARTRSLLGANYGFLMLANAEGSELRGITAYGVDAEAFRQERIKPGTEITPVAQSFQRKQPIVVTDVAHNPLVSKRLRQQYGFLGSVWIVPLLSGTVAVGIFAVGYAIQREATAEELRFLQLLGDEAALAIERSRLTEELQESEKRYRSLFENANDAIITITLEGTITGVNRGLEVMLGWSREELIGQHYSKTSTPASIALADDRTRRTLAGEIFPSIFELEMVRKDGSSVPVEGRARFIRDKEGQPLGLQGIFRDISAKKELERQRSEFLAMLTHDIRNPLEVVLGYSEILCEKAQERDAPEEVNLLARLTNSTLIIHSLVTNYLDFSRIEAGRLTLSRKLLEVNTILRQVAQQYETEAWRRRLTLDMHLQDALPWVAGDPLALERAFANLLHNALKFTPAGGRVSLSSAQQNQEIVITVADTGPGIAAEELPLLFEKYRRAAATQQREGVGLGLFIVKALVEAHGGRIEAESTPGSGSCFAVFLPIASTDQAETA